MSKNQQTMKPNRLALAIQELSGMVAMSDVPTTIQSGEAGGYIFIGVKSSDNQSGTAKVHKAKMLYAPINKYNDMLKTQHVFNGIFNGMFNKLVMLHDPTIPAVKEVTKKISNIDKGKIKTMHSNGLPSDEIAATLGLEVEKVEEYIIKL